ncbi:MAG: hypothetical protein V3V52_07225 [Candidatus Adiutricales bacterium]
MKWKEWLGSQADVDLFMAVILRVNNEYTCVFTPKIKKNGRVKR